jgi:hypothetical protein
MTSAAVVTLGLVLASLTHTANTAKTQLPPQAVVRH